jgi:uncharacterized membrane protein YjjB (DUF3815 family)
MSMSTTAIPSRLATATLTAARSGGPRRLPPRIVLILAGFFALTVGALALCGLAVIDGGQHIQGFNDLRDAITQTLALTVGLVVGALSVGAFLTRILGRREVLA